MILALETDALEIYSKYLALNATHPIAVTDEIRQGVEGELVHISLLISSLSLLILVSAIGNVRS